jgi:hypothetical protein
LTLSPRTLTLFWLGKTYGKVHAIQVAARHGQVTRLLSATGQDNRIEVLQLFRGDGFLAQLVPLDSLGSLPPSRRSGRLRPAVILRSTRRPCEPSILKSEYRSAASRQHDRSFRTADVVAQSVNCWAAAMFAGPEFTTFLPVLCLGTMGDQPRLGR